MRILITGVNGQLGYELSRVLRDDNHEIIGTTRKIMDITDFTKVREFINRVEPDMVIHCAAYTAVDKAEMEVDICENVYVSATDNLDILCGE